MHALEAVVPGAWAPAEAAQETGGGSNPRFGPFSDAPPAAPAVQSCALVTDRPELVRGVSDALGARGVECRHEFGPADAVVVALAGRPAVTDARTAWERILASHEGLVDDIQADAAWVRAVAEAGRPVRLVTITDAATSGGRSRAQAAAQLARAGRKATGDLVTPFAIAVEAAGTEASVGALVSHLVCNPEATALSGAELVVADGWLGLRSHPRPGGSIVLGEPGAPAWLDDALRAIVR